MPPKKMPQKAGEEEDPTLNIIRFYKKKCDLNGIPPQNQCKFFKDKVDALTNEGEQLEKAIKTLIILLTLIFYSFIYGMNWAQFMLELCLMPYLI